MPNGKIELDPKSIINRAAQVRVQNAMNPLLWMSAVGPVVCFFFGWLAGFSTVIGGVLVAAGILPIVAVIVAYAFFALKDPDRLQSETFLLRQQELIMLGKGGTAKTIDTSLDQFNPDARTEIKNLESRS